MNRDCGIIEFVLLRFNSNVKYSIIGSLSLLLINVHSQNGEVNGQSISALKKELEVS